VTTVSDALSTAECSTHPNAIVVLPPAAGDSPTDSDTKQVPESLVDNKPLETAGELEVEAEVSDSKEEQLANNDDSDDEITPPVKQQKTTKGEAKPPPPPKWSKSATFSKSISSTEAMHVAD